MKAFILSVTVALGLGTAAHAQLDPKALILTPIDQVHWTGRPGGPETALIAGDPTQSGSLYVQLIKWPPHSGSRPHSHPNDRYITVLSGTWWVATGTHYRPETMVPVKTGTMVTHFANEVHYDGTRDEGAIIEVVGIGPGTLVPREEK